MILQSSIEAFKKSNPLIGTGGFESVFKLDNGSATAFVVLTKDGKYPLTFNQEGYPEDLLQKEILGVIERYYTFNDTKAGDDNHAIGPISVRRHEASMNRLKRQTRWLEVSIALLLMFLALIGVSIVFHIYGTISIYS